LQTIFCTGAETALMQHPQGKTQTPQKYFFNNLQIFAVFFDLSHLQQIEKFSADRFRERKNCFLHGCAAGSGKGKNCLFARLSAPFRMCKT